MSKRNIQIDFTPLANMIDEGMSPAKQARIYGSELKRLSIQFAEDLAAGLDRERKDDVARLDRFIKRWQKRHLNIWGEPISYLELFCGICEEFVLDLAEDLEEKAIQANDFKFEALLRLHARSCLTAGEILTLLKSGYATGANARWRTLYELSIVAMFLSEHDATVAERFLLHRDIRAYRNAVEMNEFAGRLKLRRVPARELRRLEAQSDLLLLRFGPSYRNEYGWASETLTIGNPTFSELAKSVKLDHWKPYVRMASHGVHAGSSGAFWDLGSPTGLGALPAGPSGLGLVDPGQNTAISMLCATVPFLLHAFMKYEPLEGVGDASTVRTVVLGGEMRVLPILCDACVDSFLDTNDAIRDTPIHSTAPPRFWKRPNFNL